MARPTVTRDEAVSFAPEQRAAPQLGVFAPLNVRESAGGAAALAEALGLINSAAQPIAQMVNEDRAQAGATDARLSRIDKKRYEEQTAYRRAAMKIEAEKAGIEFITAWNARYTEELPKDISEDQIAADFDAQAREKLAPFLNDPEQSAVLAKMLGDHIAEVGAKHRAKLAEEYREDAVKTQSAVLRGAVAKGEKVPAEEIMAKLRPLLGNSAATKTYVDIVGALAQERGEPELIDALIPDAWADGTPGPKNVPALANDLNQYRYLAQRNREALSEKARAEARALQTQTETQLTVLAYENPAEAMRQVIALGKQGLVDSDTVKQIVAFAQGQRDDRLEFAIDAEEVAGARLAIMEGRVKREEIPGLVRRLFPPGRNGAVAAAQFMDDAFRDREAFERAEGNPRAKSLRAWLESQTKPAVMLPGTPEATRYAETLLAFDLAFQKDGDADKALAAALDRAKLMPPTVLGVGKPTTLATPAGTVKVTPLPRP